MTGRPGAGGRVLCVTLNAALDVTYEAPTMVAGDVNRVEHTHTHAGGKGVNVARLLTAWQREAIVLGFAGGRVGEEITASLDDGGIAHHLVACAGESRRTVTVVGTRDGTSTGFYEAGPRISPAEWSSLRATFETLLAAGGLVVLSGSLPPGVPDDGYRQLAATAREYGLPVVVDAHGKPLLHALDARPTVVTPNEAELADALGLARPVPLESAVGAARRLVSLGADRAVATLGSRGLIGVLGSHAWQARSPSLTGNPVGAGDAVVAVLADGELAGEAWPDVLHRAQATAAAAVRAPIAGAVDPQHVSELWQQVEVREL